MSNWCLESNFGSHQCRRLRTHPPALIYSYSLESFLLQDESGLKAAEGGTSGDTRATRAPPARRAQPSPAACVAGAKRQDNCSPCNTLTMYI